MDKDIKKILIYLCIIIVIIIILRFLYLRLKNQYVNYMNNNTIEKFDNGGPIDLLSKTKSNMVMTSNISSISSVSIIKPWTTKLYNLENHKTKAISLYQPNLFINNSQYCKLGDMLSINPDYSPPNTNQLSLFIKKNTSDIKPPVSYNLIVNFGTETVNPKYYQFESYIDNINIINSILPNLSNISKVFTDMDAIILNNYDKLATNLATNIINVSNITITIDSKISYIRDLLNHSINGNINSESPDAPNLTKPACPTSCPGGIGSKSNFTDTDKPTPDCPLTCGFTSSISIPAGVKGKFITNTDSIIPFSIDGTIDNGQSLDKTKILSKVSNIPFTNLTINNIDIKTYNYNLFELIPIMDIINFLSGVCTNINTIYSKESSNIAFLQYLNLVNDISIINNILASITAFNNFISKSSYSDLYNLTIYSHPELLPYFNNIINTIPIPDNTVIGLIFNVLQNMELTYNLSTINFDSKDIIISEPFTNVSNNYVNNRNYTNDTIEHFYSFWPVGGGSANRGMSSGGTSVDSASDGNSPTITLPPTSDSIVNINMDSFQNNFMDNIPSANYNITLVYTNEIKITLTNILEFVQFQSNLSKNAIPNLPLKIYEPVAPKDYVALGHVFCNFQEQLKEIQTNDKIGKGVCCVPKNCVKEIRNWNASDKVFEYNQDNTYWALYFNPYIGTFISTNVNELPSGMVSKVIACVKKCTAVDELKIADKCARNYNDINKSIKKEVNLGTDLVSDQEEVFYLEKLKTQSDSITRLSNKAQQLQLGIDKATIVNSEMNKNKLQSYVDEQKANIETILKRLIKDKDSIQTNINIPIDVLNKILEMIKNLNISQSEKNKLLSELLLNRINNKQLICPGYDLAGLVKKQMVSDVCYGCN